MPCPQIDTQTLKFLYWSFQHECQQYSMLFPKFLEKWIKPWFCFPHRQCLSDCSLQYSRQHLNQSKPNICTKWIIENDYNLLSIRTKTISSTEGPEKQHLPKVTKQVKKTNQNSTNLMKKILIPLSLSLYIYIYIYTHTHKTVNLFYIPSEMWKLPLKHISKNKEIRWWGMGDTDTYCWESWDNWQQNNRHCSKEPLHSVSHCTSLHTIYSQLQRNKTKH